MPGRRRDDDASCDVLVVGGGLAGLYAVLHLPGSLDVLVVDKGPGGTAGSSPLAQGGMAVAVGPEDSPELHAADTERVGAGACDRAAVEVLAGEALDVLEHLISLGCVFDHTPDGVLDLNREGGQSVARSVHTADATGRELMRVVGEAARTRARRLIGAAVGLDVADGRCTGARIRTADGVSSVRAGAVLLATGGCGALYEATTNAPASTGDGIAVAHDAGARVTDLEFVQFHPTVLDVPGHRNVLLTEALRGEGAIVVDASGERFLDGHHPDAELAPRDIVARAIAARGGALLDCRPIGRRDLERRFPNVAAAVGAAGFDIVRDLIPVAPAAHYLLGGVATNTRGQTSLPGLWAAGECAATGLHGANRMAGNSLTEAVVFGRRAAHSIAAEIEDVSGVTAADVPAQDVQADEDAWRSLRAAMTSGAGLARTADGLDEALLVLGGLASSPDPNLSLAAAAAMLVCRSALEREESRGVHFRADHPSPDPAWDGRRVSL